MGGGDPHPTGIRFAYIQIIGVEKLVNNERKRILTPDMFAVNDEGEVVIRNQDLISRVKGHQDHVYTDDRGVWISIVTAE